MVDSSPVDDAGVDEPWTRNDVQFPRLIAEAQAAGVFTQDVLAAMADSMDLSVAEIAELLDRAQRAWEAIKEHTLDAESQAIHERLLSRAAELHQSSDLEFDGPLYPHEVSAGDDGDWVRAWAWVPHEEQE